MSKCGGLTIRKSDPKKVRPSNLLELLVDVENYGLEYELEDGELVKMTALVDTIDSILKPAVDHFLWCDDDIYGRFTRNLYNHPLGYIQSFYRMNRWRRERIEASKYSQSSLCFRDLTSEEIGCELYSTAQVFMTSLSYFLGQKAFFAGDKPTAADAYFVARIWPLIYYECRNGNLNWPAVTAEDSRLSTSAGSHPLITHLLQCPNLVRHFKRILSQYLPKLDNNFRQVCFARSAASAQSIYAHPVRDFFVFGSGAMALFLLYAYKNGIIRFRTT